jgi:hypothetical protein
MIFIGAAGCTMDWRQGLKQSLELKEANNVSPGAQAFCRNKNIADFPLLRLVLWWFCLFCMAEPPEVQRTG